VIPHKSIVSPEHVQIFGKSNACHELMDFITTLQTSVKSTRMTKTPLTTVSCSFD